MRINGEVHHLSESKSIDPRNSKVIVEIVVDRIVLSTSQQSRLADSLELAFSEGNNQAIVLIEDQEARNEWRELLLSNRLACVNCGEMYDPISPKHFSWNHAEGACYQCGGLGKTLQFQPELICT